MRDRLVFYVNDAKHEVRGEAAALTLSDFLRRGVGGPALCGTKIACAEGDCGACTVLVGHPNDDGDRIIYQTIDACIAFVYQLDRSHVVTVEGLTPEQGFNPVQAAMVDCHGSQCGFCTPGFVMALQGLVEQQGSVPLTEAGLRLGLSGNLCRCTGYAQILEAGLRCGAGPNESVAECFDTAAMLEDFASLTGSGVHVNSPAPSHADDTDAERAVEVVLPTTLDELITARAELPEAKIVAGATDVGVQFNHGKIAPRAVIATGGVSELRSIAVVDDELVIGAGVTWSEIEAFVEEAIPEYHAILTRFGSPQVRHAGTLAGNLANASPIADSIPLHYVTESVVELTSVGGSRLVPIESFYRGYKDLDLRADEVITAVRTPLPGDDVQLRLYKVSKRRDMDISTVTLGVWLRVDGDRIAEARLAAGGVGPTVLRLPQAERALNGAILGLDALRKAGRLAASEVNPLTDVRGGADYRRQLVANLFVKCWYDLHEKPRPSVRA